MHTVRVWDLPTRLFHWLLALSVIGMVITANVGGNAMPWHFRLGYAIATLLLFRVVWGFVGGRWSRFGSFIYSPATLLRHLRGQTPASLTTGHSPTGALSVFALLAVLMAQVGSGMFSDDDIAFSGPLVSLVSEHTVGLATKYHKEIGKFIVMALVVLHLLAIAYYKWVKKTDLVRPMIHGDKALSEPVPPSRDGWGNRLTALVVLLLCAVVVNRIIALGASASLM